MIADSLVVKSFVVLVLIVLLLSGDFVEASQSSTEKEDADFQYANAPIPVYFQYLDESGHERPIDSPVYVLRNNPAIDDLRQCRCYSELLKLLKLDLYQAGGLAKLGNDFNQRLTFLLIPNVVDAELMVDDNGVVRISGNIEYRISGESVQKIKGLVFGEKLAKYRAIDVHRKYLRDLYESRLNNARKPD